MAKPRPHNKHASRLRQIAGDVLKADPLGDAEQSAFEAWRDGLSRDDMREIGRKMKAYMDEKQKT